MTHGFDPIFVECPCCDGSGVHVVPSRHFHSRWDPDPPEYYNEEEVCSCCDGTGSAEIDADPITMEDLPHEDED